MQKKVNSRVAMRWWRQLGLALVFAGSANAAEPKQTDAVHVAAPFVVENLTIFPMQGAADVEAVALTTLDAALKKGDAEVKELGDGEVNRLQIKNTGKLPIYVLAGTVVKGGNQDRQIGQDFVIEQGKRVAVDAFCVEQGRWTAERAGRATHGKFSATRGVALSSVRGAAQYKRDQSEVWSKVSEVNAANKKSAPSGTLMATLDDAGVAKKRAELVRAIEAGLVQAETQAPLVGLGYAVDGKVRDVRFFRAPNVFALFRSTLLESAALDALTAQAATGKRSAPKIEATVAEDFMHEVDTGAIRTRDTEAQNRNEYKETKTGYGSKARLKSQPAAAPISEDYLAK